MIIDYLLSTEVNREKKKGAVFEREFGEFGASLLRLGLGTGLISRSPGHLLRGFLNWIYADCQAR